MLIDTQEIQCAISQVEQAN